MFLEEEGQEEEELPATTTHWRDLQGWWRLTEGNQVMNMMRMMTKMKTDLSGVKFSFNTKINGRNAAGAVWKDVSGWRWCYFEHHHNGRQDDDKVRGWSSNVSVRGRWENVIVCHLAYYFKLVKGWGLIKGFFSLFFYFCWLFEHRMQWLTLKHPKNVVFMMINYPKSL